MHYLPFFNEVPFFYLLQAAFMIWMLVDCRRRRVEDFWFWIILFVPFFGAWAYFFVVKARDFRGRGLGDLHFWPFHSRPSLDELRFRVQQTPTIAHHLALAERLIEQDEYVEAVPHVEEAVKREPDYGQALYLLALCHVHSGQPEKALPLLERIVARDRRWGNYKAWYLLREARAQAGDQVGALSAYQELAGLAPTLQNKCLLAEQLLEMGRGEEARPILERGIEEYSFAPRSLRWRNRRWASKARRLQKRIPQGSSQGR